MCTRSLCLAQLALLGCYVFVSLSALLPMDALFSWLVCSNVFV